MGGNGATHLKHQRFVAAAEQLDRGDIGAIESQRLLHALLGSGRGVIGSCAQAVERDAFYFAAKQHDMHGDLLTGSLELDAQAVIGKPQVTGTVAARRRGSRGGIHGVVQLQPVLPRQVGEGHTSLAECGHAVGFDFGAGERDAMLSGQLVAQAADAEHDGFVAAAGHDDPRDDLPVARLQDETMGFALCAWRGRRGDFVAGDVERDGLRTLWIQQHDPYFRRRAWVLEGDLHARGRKVDLGAAILAFNWLAMALIYGVHQRERAASLDRNQGESVVSQPLDRAPARFEFPKIDTIVGRRWLWLAAGVLDTADAI